METAVSKIKMIMLEYSMAFITLYLRERTDGRAATVSISPKDSSDVVTMLPEELSILLQKIENSRLDGTIFVDNPTTPFSYELKLYKYDFGNVYKVIHRNNSAIIDEELINALIHAEGRLQSFLGENLP